MREKIIGWTKALKTLITITSLLKKLSPKILFKILKGGFSHSIMFVFL